MMYDLFVDYKHVFYMFSAVEDSPEDAFEFMKMAAAHDRAPGAKQAREALETCSVDDVEEVKVDPLPTDD